MFATIIAVNPIPNPSRKKARARGMPISLLSVHQTTNQNAATKYEVGMRIVEYACAGTKKIQPNAARKPMAAFSRRRSPPTLRPPSPGAESRSAT